MYKVVIIDDEPIIVEGLSRLLPWKNITAGLQPQPATELDGLSMIAALKVEFPDMEISILTGFRESHIFPECLRRTRGFLRTSTEIQRLPENYQKSKNCMKSNGVRLTSF